MPVVMRQGFNCTTRREWPLERSRNPALSRRGRSKTPRSSRQLHNKQRMAFLQHTMMQFVSHISRLPGPTTRNTPGLETWARRAAQTGIGPTLISITTINLHVCGLMEMVMLRDRQAFKFTSLRLEARSSHQRVLCLEARVSHLFPTQGYPFSTNIVSNSLFLC